MPNRRSDIDIVAHHDALIDGLTTRMGAVEKTLSAHGTVLQEIRDVVVKQGARPHFDPRNTIGIVKDIGIVFGIVCAGILYLASANTQSFMADSRTEQAIINDRQQQNIKRVERLESLVLPQSWAGVVKE